MTRKHIKEIPKSDINSIGIIVGKPEKRNGQYRLPCSLPLKMSVEDLDMGLRKIKQAYLSNQQALEKGLKARVKYGQGNGAKIHKKKLQMYTLIHDYWIKETKKNPKAKSKFIFYGINDQLKKDGFKVLSKDRLRKIIDECKRSEQQVVSSLESVQPQSFQIKSKKSGKIYNVLQIRNDD